MLAELDKVLDIISNRAPGVVVAAFAILAWLRAERKLARVELRLFRVMGAAPRPFDIGGLLRAFYQLPRRALKDAVRLQTHHEPHTRLGTILQKQGAVTGPQVERCLRMQDALRQGKLPTTDELVKLADYVAEAMRENINE